MMFRKHEKGDYAHFLETTWVKEYSKKDNAEVVVICAKVESDLCDMDNEERNLFLQELGVEESIKLFIVQNAIVFNLLINMYLRRFPEWKLVKVQKI